MVRGLGIGIPELVILGVLSIVPLGSTWGTAVAGFLAALVTLPGTATGDGAVISVMGSRLGGFVAPVVDPPSTMTYTILAAGALVLYGAALFAPLGGRARS